MPDKTKKIRKVAISEFKAKCCSLLDEVSKTKAPIRIMRRVKAMADVVPVLSGTAPRNWIGSLPATVKITGDIVSPVIEFEDIEALK